MKTEMVEARQAESAETQRVKIKWHSVKCEKPKEIS